MTPLEVLQKTRDLITRPHEWTQHALARYSRIGGEVPIDDPGATCYCLVGALGKAAGVTTDARGRSMNTEAYEATLARLVPSEETTVARERQLVNFNDRSIQKDVLAFLDKEISRLGER